jgi:hypothetical protein
MAVELQAPAPRKRRRATLTTTQCPQLEWLRHVQRAIANNSETRKTAETVHLRCGGKIIIPLAPIRAKGFDVDGVFASLVSRDLIGRAEHFYYARCGFQDPGKADIPGAFNAFDLLDEFLSFTLAGAKPHAVHSVAGHA